jgi:hypothetical protein
MDLLESYRICYILESHFLQTRIYLKYFHCFANILRSTKSSICHSKVVRAIGSLIYCIRNTKQHSNSQIQICSKLRFVTSSLYHLALAPEFRCQIPEHHTLRVTSDARNTTRPASPILPPWAESFSHPNVSAIGSLLSWVD